MRVYSSSRTAGSRRRAARSSASFSAAVQLHVDDSLHEGQVFRDRAELAASAKTERLVERAFEPVVALLDDTVLVPFTGPNARRLEPVVLDDIGEALRQTAPSRPRELVGRGREVIEANGFRDTAERPERRLHAAEERLERLSERELDEAPAAEREDELEEEMNERQPSDDHAELGRVREVDRSHFPGRV